MLVVGLPCLGLDSRLHPALGDVGGDGAAPAHGFVGARQMHHGVRLLRAPIQAKGAVRAPHAKRKLLLQGVQHVAALGVEPLHLRFVQGSHPVHVIRLQVHVDGHDHALYWVSDLGEIGCLALPASKTIQTYMHT